MTVRRFANSAHLPEVSPQRITLAFRRRHPPPSGPHQERGARRRSGGIFDNRFAAAEVAFRASRGHHLLRCGSSRRSSTLSRGRALAANAGHCQCHGQSPGRGCWGAFPRHLAHPCSELDLRRSPRSHPRPAGPTASSSTTAGGGENRPCCTGDGLRHPRGRCRGPHRLGRAPSARANEKVAYGARPMARPQRPSLGPKLRCRNGAGSARPATIASTALIYPSRRRTPNPLFLWPTRNRDQFG